MPTPWSLVNLPPLAERTSGAPDVLIGVIDGPVALDHPSLAAARIVPADGVLPAVCPQHGRGAACRHGTFVTGMLLAPRDGATPGICPGCTVLAVPLHTDRTADSQASPRQLAAAVHRCLDAGVSVINISSAVGVARVTGGADLTAALDRAAARDVLVVAAAGNEPVLGASVLSGHPWVIPVVGCDASGAPLARSTLGLAIGARGLGAPGRSIVGPAADGGTTTLNGSSFAAPFVTGTAALLRTLFPQAGAGSLRHALTAPPTGRRRSVVPPLLDAERAHATLQRSHHGRRTA